MQVSWLLHGAMATWTVHCSNKHVLVRERARREHPLRSSQQFHQWSHVETVHLHPETLLSGMGWRHGPDSQSVQIEQPPRGT